MILVLLVFAVIGKRRGPPPEFSWLLPYHQNSSNGPQEKDTVSTASTVAAGDLDSLAPDAASLGDVSVDVAQTPSPPYLNPAVNNAETSSVHVRQLAWFSGSLGMQGNNDKKLVFRWLYSMGYSVNMREGERERV